MDAANLEQYEKTLADNQFLGGQLPTAADKDAYELLKNNVPSVESHPHTFAWFVLTSRFTDAVRNTWAAPAAKGGDKKAAPAKKEVAKEEKPVAAATADDDELDLFGDGPTEEELKALEEKKKQLEEAKKAKAKPAVIAKSLILFDVKPYEAETDLDELFKKIITIDMDGLVWKQDNKKEPIAYGVYKLVVGCVIEDEKICVDDLVDKMMEYEDEVQSVDIAVFNKI